MNQKKAGVRVVMTALPYPISTGSALPRCARLGYGVRA